MERMETYTQGTGDAETQFGEYQMTMVPNDFGTGSADHTERRIQAVLALAQ
jgi:hypothetical protein